MTPSRPSIRPWPAPRLALLLVAAGLDLGCGHRRETAPDDPGPRPAPTPSALASPATPLDPKGAPSASAAPAPAGDPVTLAACTATAPAAPAQRVSAKESLAKAPEDQYAKVRVGSGPGARLIPQPPDLAALFERMAAPVAAADAVFVACKAEATQPLGTNETLEITASIGSTPVFLARTSPFAIAGATLSAGQSLRLSGARTSEQCTWSMTGLIPIPQKICTPSSKALQPLTATPGAGLPAVLTGPDMRAECRGLDRAAVEREAAAPLAAAERRFGELCGQMRIDPAGAGWGWSGGSGDDLVWKREVAAAAALLGFADPRVDSQGRRNAAARSEWTAALGGWVRRKGAALPLGATDSGKSGARYRVSTPLACAGWPFEPARATPLGVDLPKGSRACWLRLEVQNGTAAPMTLEDAPSGIRPGGEHAHLHAVTATGEQPDVFVRGVDRGKELRYVVRLDEKIAPGAAVPLVVTLFLSDAAARGTDPLLLAVGGEALLRLR